MDVLPQSEIDSLLASIETGDIDFENANNKTGPRKIQIWDFRRPDRFTKEQIRTLSSLHENFARNVSVVFSQRVREQVQMHVASVDQLTFEDFIRAVPNPTMMTILSVPPLPGPGLLELDPVVSGYLLDRLMGGSAEILQESPAYTELEKEVLWHFSQGLMDSLAEAWSSILTIRPQIDRLETNPMRAPIIPMQEMVALITFEVTVGQVRGMMTLCLPPPMLDPIALELTSSGVGVSPSITLGQPIGLEFYSDLEVPSVIYQPIGDLSLTTVQKLKKGSLVPLPNYPGRKTFWEVGGQRMARVELVAGDASPSRIVEKLNPTPLLKRERVLLSLPPEIPKDLEPEDDGDLFSFLANVDPGAFLLLLGREAPQTAALVLSCLAPAVAAPLFAALETTIQSEVGNRIAHLEPVSRRLLVQVSRVLEKDLSGHDGTVPARMGGPAFLDEIK